MFAGGQDENAALSISGAYGTPLLYGAVPVAMAWTQRRRLQQATSSNQVPGRSATQGGLGVGALAFMCQELVQDVSVQDVSGALVLDRAMTLVVVSVNETVVIWVICNHESDHESDMGEEVIVCLTS
jgi:hypothetical protein